MKTHIWIGMLASLLGLPAAAADDPALTLDWEDHRLTISGDALPGGSMEILYIEAYCRPGSTERPWDETVIGHETELLERSADGARLVLRDTLDDGVVVTHTITAADDEIDFRLIAHNPTDTASQAHWAQPCVRVDLFTGTTRDDARALAPAYVRQSFIFIDDKLAMLPTEPWATEALYTPGQVYCPSHVDRDDVNPRPLSSLVPSNGLIGCFSADRRQIAATAWEPYQELFQGVIACLHSDYRIAGLDAGETKSIRGKLYLVDADVAQLLERYEADFPEQR